MKRIGCLLLSATMILTLMPALAYTASAADISPKVIYSNDFENSSNLPVGKTTTDMVSNVNGSTAVSYDAKFDATSSWDEKVNVELNTEYADPIYT
jgi:hypothetical protein